MEEKILEILKKGEKSTTEISNLINRNHYNTLKILEELEKNNLIKKIEIGKYTFWRLLNAD